MYLFPLDSTSQNALMMLYKHPSGFPFDELGIDEKTFLFLLSNDFISEPQGKVIEQGISLKFCVHEGNVIIEPVGKNYVEKLIQDRKIERQKKYKILDYNRDCDCCANQVICSRNLLIIGSIIESTKAITDI